MDITSITLQEAALKIAPASTIHIKMTQLCLAFLSVPMAILETTRI